MMKEPFWTWKDWPWKVAGVLVTVFLVLYSSGFFL